MNSGATVATVDKTMLSVKYVYCLVQNLVTKRFKRK